MTPRIDRRRRTVREDEVEVENEDDAMSKPRRVVVIMTDTQRWDMVGCYGNKDMKTPHLDALASQGVRFDRAYTCQPVCGPARAGMFTGTRPHSNGSWANSMPLGDNVKTIGQRVRDNGVRAPTTCNAQSM